MLESTSDNPFYELPEALVEELLNQSDELSSKLSDSFKKIKEQKNDFRNSLKKLSLLKRDNDIQISQANPTCCGVDGSYTIEKLLSTDIVAFAALAVEGLTPPTEKRHWPKPRHIPKVMAIPHNDATPVVARSIMMAYEIQLSSHAPHDVALFDGSLTTPLIYFNQATEKQNVVASDLSSILQKELVQAIEPYKEILLSPRTDKIYAGIPKYTTSNEVAKQLGNNEFDDRGMLSFILEAGEFVGPVPRNSPSSPWHLKHCPPESEKHMKEIYQALNDLHVVYYRPYSHIPALRIEISKSIATNPSRLSIIFEALRIQCVAPSIIEPYPLYLADRMVKHLTTAIPAIRKAATQEMSAKWEEDMGDMLLAMSPYRTDWGK